MNIRDKILNLSGTYRPVTWNRFIDPKTIGITLQHVYVIEDGVIKMSEIPPSYQIKPGEPNGMVFKTIDNYIQDADNYDDWVEVYSSTAASPGSAPGHVMFRRENGDLYGYGRAYNGELGNGEEVYQQVWLESTELNSMGKDWQQVCVGNGRTFLIDEEGYLWGVGLNISGYYPETKLIDPEGGERILTPVKVTDKKWKEVYTAGPTVFAIDDDGDLYGWGNLSSFLGSNLWDDSDEPILMSEGGWERTGYCIGIRNGELWGWGDNYTNRLGTRDIDDDFDKLYYDEWTLIDDNHIWIDVISSNEATIGITENHECYGVGNATYAGIYIDPYYGGNTDGIDLIHGQYLPDFIRIGSDDTDITEIYEGDNFFLARTKVKEVDSIDVDESTIELLTSGGVPPGDMHKVEVNVKNKFGMSLDGFEIGDMSIYYDVGDYIRESAVQQLTDEGGGKYTFDVINPSLDETEYYLVSKGKILTPEDVMKTTEAPNLRLHLFAGDRIIDTSLGGYTGFLRGRYDRALYGDTFFDATPVDALYNMEPEEFPNFYETVARANFGDLYPKNIIMGHIGGFENGMFTQTLMIFVHTNDDEMKSFVITDPNIMDFSMGTEEDITSDFGSEISHTTVDREAVIIGKDGRFWVFTDIMINMQGLELDDSVGPEHFSLVENVPENSVKGYLVGRGENFYTIDNNNKLYAIGKRNGYAIPDGNGDEGEELEFIEVTSNEHPNIEWDLIASTGTFDGAYYGLSKDGKLYAWGHNDHTGLGIDYEDGGDEYTEVITEVEHPDGLRWDKISANYIVVALDENGALWGWGVRGYSLGLEHSDKILAPYKLDDGPWKDCVSTDSEIRLLKEH